MSRFNEGNQVASALCEIDSEEGTNAVPQRTLGRRPARRGKARGIRTNCISLTVLLHANAEKPKQKYLAMWRTSPDPEAVLEKWVKEL